MENSQEHNIINNWTCDWRFDKFFIEYILYRTYYCGWPNHLEYHCSKILRIRVRCC